ncbi:MAG: M23 family metallopeptidase, partial [Gammaproteobacteria bacterium]
SLPEYRPSSAFSPPARIAVDIDQAALDAEVPAEDVDALTICGVTRSRGCDPFDAVKLGMRPTGLGPRFPDTLACKGIDDYWALDYSYKRNRQAWHGGIDMPADWGTPILAVADGSVVAVFSGENSKRGKEVIIRHSPEQTGIPYWTYSGYGHLDALPPFEPGQRIQQGQIIGPTGNSGLGSRGSQTSNRRAAIHFSVLYSESPEYAIVDGELVPKDARWMDPVGFYRLTPPYETRALKALPESEKFIDIPVMTAGAGVTPTGAQRIWPYACDTDSQSSRRSSSSSPQSAFDF